MPGSSRIVSLVVVIALAWLAWGHGVAAEESASVVDQGREAAFDRQKGNCLACHQIEGGDLAGNIGPPLIAMQQRFPDKGRLRAQIWDPTLSNPATIMPPFGLHGILTEQEIDQITEFVYPL